MSTRSSSSNLSGSSRSRSTTHSWLSLRYRRRLTRRVLTAVVLAVGGVGGVVVIGVAVVGVGVVVVVVVVAVVVGVGVGMVK